jgi:hypothetical protein
MIDVDTLVPTPLSGYINATGRDIFSLVPLWWYNIRSQKRLSSSDLPTFAELLTLRKRKEAAMWQEEAALTVVQAESWASLVAPTKLTGVVGVGSNW